MREEMWRTTRTALRPLAKRFKRHHLPRPVYRHAPLAHDLFENIHNYATCVLPRKTRKARKEKRHYA